MSLPMSVAPNAAAGSPASVAPTPNSPLKAVVNADAAAKTAAPLVGTVPAQTLAAPVPPADAPAGTPVAPTNTPSSAGEPKKATPIAGVPNGLPPYQPTQSPTMPGAAEKKQ